MAVNEQKPIDEQAARVQWQARAKDMTVANLPEFIRELALDYNHDYGTICVAMGAAALAAVYALEHSPAGGITGFQAGAVQWEFIRGWNASGAGDNPQRLVDFGNLLYPQYDEYFTAISPDTAKWLKEEATRRLADGLSPHEKLREHWTKLASGWVPFGLTVEDR